VTPDSPEHTRGALARILGPILLVAAFLALGLHFNGALAAARSRAPLAVGGTMDLRSWDFRRDGPAELAGEWLFYPGVLLGGKTAEAAEGGVLRSVPDLWKGDSARGAGTYRLRLLLPPARDGLAIRYTTVSTAFELEADAVPIASAGRPALSRAAARAAYRPGLSRLPSAGAELDLLVRVSNFEYRAGGMWRSFQLGSADALILARRRSEVAAIAIGAALAAVALNFLFFARAGRRDRSFLRFSLFALVVSLRSLVTGEYAILALFPDLPFELLIRLEYVTAYLSIPLAMLFLSTLFPREIGRGTQAAILIPFLPFALLIPVAPLAVLTGSIVAFYPLAVVAIVVGLILGPARAALRGRPGGLAMLIGCLVLFAAAVNDMLFASFLVRTGNLVPLGLLAFVGSQAFVLSSRFTTALDEARVLSSDLAAANGRLGHEIERYRESQRRLEDLVAEKDMLLKEVHHRVKNSLQIVSSIISLQSHRSSESAVLEAYSSMKSRIRAISLVHEKLYALETADALDLGGYASDLAAQLASSYRHGEMDISLETDTLTAPADFCIDFGLILTELVSNAFRHALMPQTGGGLRVTIREARLASGGRSVALRVEDPGPGFPPGFTPGASPSLGYKVVTSLVHKRGGSLTITKGSGAVVEVSLPLEGEPSGEGRKHAEERAI
jgi:two-component sensor histidine kinase